MNSNNRIADLAEDDKPREKAIKHGIRSLSDAELLALIMGSGLPGKSVIEMSREMLRECQGELSTLARMSIKELTKKFKGVGPAKAVGISAAIELGLRCSTAVPERRQVTCSADAYNYIRSRLCHLATEEFWIIILSRSNRIITAECISKGGTSATYVEVKLVVRRALDHLAAGIILAHNHPSDTANPSPEDDRLTRKIKDAAALLDIKVLDHLIITSNNYYSYNDNQRL